MTTAREIMHPGVRCVQQNETLDSAARLMRDLNVGALPICDETERMIGIITDRDIAVKCVAEGRDPSGVKCAELAQGTPRWIEADADVSEVLDAMASHQIRRLPVVADRKLVGMISEADLAQHLPKDQVGRFVEAVTS